MQGFIRITTALAAAAIAASAHAHDSPIAHAHAAPESLLIVVLIIGAGMLLIAALKQARAAHRKRARQAIPVVMIRPGLRLFRDR